MKVQNFSIERYSERLDGPVCVCVCVCVYVHACMHVMVGKNHTK